MSRPVICSIGREEIDAMDELFTDIHETKHGLRAVCVFHAGQAIEAPRVKLSPLLDRQLRDETYPAVHDDVVYPRMIDPAHPEER